VQDVLDYYPKKKLWTVNNPMKKMKHMKQCLFIEKSVKYEDAYKEDGQRQAMKNPTEGKLMTWKLPGAAKAMPEKTPAESSWRIWNLGRGKEHVLLRVVIV
jgi:hypothetical protein